MNPVNALLIEIMIIIDYYQGESIRKGHGILWLPDGAGDAVGFLPVDP